MSSACWIVGNDVATTCTSRTAMNMPMHIMANPIQIVAGTESVARVSAAATIAIPVWGLLLVNHEGTAFKEVCADSACVVTSAAPVRWSWPLAPACVGSRGRDQSHRSRPIKKRKRNHRIVTSAGKIPASAIRSCHSRRISERVTEIWPSRTTMGCKRARLPVSPMK